jgi:hypothetical protein
MSGEWQPGIDRDAAERLLRGAPADPGAAGTDPLAALLAAAAAPAREDELAGEPAALAAFREASHTRPSWPARARTAIGKAVTVKIGVIVAAAAVGGVAVAGAAVTVAPAVIGAGGGPSASPAPGRATEPRTASPTASPSVSPDGGGVPRSVVALCARYAAAPARDRDALLDDPAFATLVAVAGGRSGVAKVCRTNPSSAPRVGQPAGTATPASPPTVPTYPPGKPTYPPGKPTVHPTPKTPVEPTLEKSKPTEPGHGT